MKLFALSFFTEGPPHDHGASLSRAAELFREAVSPHVDSYLALSPRHLAALGPEAQATYADLNEWVLHHPQRREVKRHNPRWAVVGFQRWKPFIVRRQLESADMAMGDILLYHDVNCIKYPQYLTGCSEWRGLCQSVLAANQSDVFVPAGLPLHRDVKAMLVRRYLGNAYRYHLGVWNGLMVIRKSDTTLDLVREWDDMCSDLSNISPLPNPSPYRSTIWHSVDQSVLGVLAQVWKREGRLPEHWPRFAEGNRVFDAEMLNRPAVAPPPPFVARLWASISRLGRSRT